MAEKVKIRRQVIDPDWRKREETLTEIIRKYPAISPFIIITTDVQRRGIAYTDTALAQFNPDVHQTVSGSSTNQEGRWLPASVLLRDGTSIICSEVATQTRRDPYVVDVADGKLVLTDDGEVIEEVEYWEKPNFFNKVTSRGTPMFKVIAARPQRYSVQMSSYCHFWTIPGHGCKYCSIGSGGVKTRGTEHERVNLQDLRETMQELVKEKGRFVGVILTGGSIISGTEPFEDELQGYIDALQVLGSVFETKRFPSQVNSTALTRRQLERLYTETGLTSYTTDLECFDERLYKWVCPGKAAHISFDEWKNRLYHAVDVFGKGQVNTGIVSGVELAMPEGFKTEDEAVAADLELAEELTSHGVGLKHDVWHVGPNSMFFNQNTPSLDYYIRITRGFYELMRKYGISTYMDSYRKCGNHPNINMDRI
jgi:hypothetical protein